MNPRSSVFQINCSYELPDDSISGSTVAEIHRQDALAVKAAGWSPLDSFRVVGERQGKQYCNRRLRFFTGDEQQAHDAEKRLGAAGFLTLLGPDNLGRERPLG